MCGVGAVALFVPGVPNGEGVVGHVTNKPDCLVPLQLPEDEKDKTKPITFQLKIRAGAAQGSPSYKKHMRTFNEGTPQE